MMRKLSAIVIILSLIFSITHHIVYPFDNAGALNDPPQPPEGGTVYVNGLWTVTDTRDYYNCTIIMNGDLVVDNGGSLTFRNVTLLMNNTFNGTFNIEVRNGGSFFIYDFDNNSYTREDTSNITNINPEFRFMFDVNDGANLILNNSELHRCGWDIPNYGLTMEAEIVSIMNSNITNNYRGLYFIRSSNNTVFNNTIAFNQEDGIRLANSSHSDILNNTVYNNTESGIYVHMYNDFSRFNNIVGNEFYRNNRGVEFNAGAYYINVTHNKIYENLDSGIYDLGGGFYNISKNDIFQNGLSNFAGIVMYSDDNFIYDNNIFGNKEYGIAMVTSHRNTLLENVVNDTYTTGSGGLGIGVWESTECDFIYNDVYDNVNVGVHVMSVSGISRNNHFERNNVYNNGGGLYLSDHGNNTVISNNISDNGGNGIWVTSSNNNNISHNQISLNNLHNVVIDNSRNNTIFNNTITDARFSAGIYVYDSSLYINISNNIILRNDQVGVVLSQSSQFCRIDFNNISQHGWWGVYLDDVAYNEIRNNTINQSTFFSGFEIRSSFENQITGNVVKNHPIGIVLTQDSHNNTFSYNLITSNDGNGIDTENSPDNTFDNNEISWNPGDGVQLRWKSDNSIFDSNYIHNNTQNGVYIEDSINASFQSNSIYNNTLDGIDLLRSNKNTFNLDLIAENKKNGVHARAQSSDTDFLRVKVLGNSDNGTLAEGSSSNIYFENSTILGSGYRDIYLNTDSHVITLNTTFNKTKVLIEDDLSNLTVKWFMHVLVINETDSPVSDINISIRDNINGSFEFISKTGADGWHRWIVVTEYVQQKNPPAFTFFTPHLAFAWNETKCGKAIPNPWMDRSKVVIIRFNLTYIDFPVIEGWNLISLPLIQLSEFVVDVFDLNEGEYDAVQKYIANDLADPWKDYHTGQVRTGGNDLDSVNHLNGIWIHIIKPGGTTLRIIGHTINATQEIQLYKGWNLVGYPSLASYNRTNALNNLNFTTEIDSIWTYYSATKEWKELGESDFFEVGQGYWIHSKVEKLWKVPL
jgi:parallel beta-helix repeat protein